MCSLRGVINCGIILAVIDVLHGLFTTAFNCYNLVMDKMFICPYLLDIALCNNKIYAYNHIFGLSVFIGIGVGIVAVLFDLIYINCLIKRRPYLPWLWLIKALGVLGINGYFLAFWLIRQGSYTHINPDQPEDEYLIIEVTKALTLAQVAMLLVFCIITGAFTHLVTEERERRRNLQLEFPEISKPPVAAELSDESSSNHTNDAYAYASKTALPHSSNQNLPYTRADTLQNSTGV